MSHYMTDMFDVNKDWKTPKLFSLLYIIELAFLKNLKIQNTVSV